MTRTRTLSAIALLAVLLAGSAMTEVGGAGEAGPAGRPLLISIDDLPVAGGDLHTDPGERELITRGLLAALAKHHVPAMGLVIWGNVKTGDDRVLLRRWLAAGHELGNHSASHLDLTKRRVPILTSRTSRRADPGSPAFSPGKTTDTSASSAFPSSTREIPRPSSTPSAPISPAPGNEACR